MQKLKITTNKITEEVKRILSEIETELYRRAEQKMKSTVRLVSDIKDIGGTDEVLRMNWCGEEECGHKIEEKTEGSILGVQVGGIGKRGRCAVCGKDSDKEILCARTY